MSGRAIAVTVGTLFYVQMVTYMLAAARIQAFVDGDAARAPLTVGVLLTMCSGLAVLGIGLLMYQVLKHVDRGLAIWYPGLRIVELTVCAVGGLVLTYLLYVPRLVPRPIAVLGIAGYASLLLGVLLDLLGVLDLDADLGLVLLAPGGLLELVFLPIWLIARGFRSSSPAAPTRSPSLATAS